VNSADKPFADPVVILREDFNDAAILFHPHLGAAIPVTGVALDLWRALDGRRTLAEIADVLAAQYDQSPQVVLDDTLAFTHELHRRLFVLTEPPPAAPPPREHPRPFIIPEGAPAPVREPMSRQTYRLPLADGAQLVLRGLDADAARVVTFFAESARLAPTSEVLETSEVLVATRPCDAPGETVCLIDPPTAQKRGRRQRDACGKIVLPYEPLSPAEWLWLQVVQVAACIGVHVQARGGVLLHSALAALPPAIGGGERGGVILAAHSGAGKTTASNRLPAPWASLCDDTTLIVRDGAGAYWAHPLPTWSHIFLEQKICSWDTASAVPLRAIFLLRQGEMDRVTPVGAAHALGFLLDPRKSQCATGAKVFRSPNSPHSIANSSTTCATSCAPCRATCSTRGWTASFGVRWKSRWMRRNEPRNKPRNTRKAILFRVFRG
jgi:SynChlorMet cassette protein ScmC